mmetsp:Transcript_7114/g.19058  ORF Transcript_7114/g.19058 Transcript_7114/m.19058 type:complete len:93 (-) Transcript_7114:131-409(-)
MLESEPQTSDTPDCSHQNQLSFLTGSTLDIRKKKYMPRFGRIGLAACASMALSRSYRTAVLQHDDRFRQLPRALLFILSARTKRLTSILAAS